MSQHKKTNIKGTHIKKKAAILPFFMQYRCPFSHLE